MKSFFGIRYEFDRESVMDSIDRQLKHFGADYICVADGVVLNHTLDNVNYRNAVNGGMFSICDSSYVPLYVRWIYGEEYEQYTGSHIFMDILCERRYSMMFIGSSQNVLDGLKKDIARFNPDVENMKFMELPYCDVDDFDYQAIAKEVNETGADIIWVSLGAPKQEMFMSKLKPYLNRGVMIAVGAVFNFFSGNTDVKRAPDWMVANHLEFVHRIFMEPKKQIQRCWGIVKSLPAMLFKEWYIAKVKVLTTEVFNTLAFSHVAK